MKLTLFTSILVLTLFSCSSRDASTSAEAEASAEQGSETEKVNDVIVETDEEPSTKGNVLNDSGSYKYIDHISPNKKVKLDIEDFDPMGSYTTIITKNYHYRLVDEQLTPGIICWSENSRYAVLSNEDWYAGSGTMNVAVLNVETGTCNYLNMAEITKGLDVGEREMLVIEDIVWLDTTSFVLDGYIGYLGYSGHPGIDQNRKNKLGNNFANEKGNLRLQPILHHVKQEAASLTLEEKVKSLMKRLNGSWYSNDDVDAKMEFENGKLFLGHKDAFDFQGDIVISNFCLDPLSNQEPSKEIDCINVDDFSYSILKLTNDSLDLIYLNGRGNTLSYSKVKLEE